MHGAGRDCTGLGRAAMLMAGWAGPGCHAAGVQAAESPSPGQLQGSSCRAGRQDKATRLLLPRLMLRPSQHLTPALSCPPSAVRSRQARGWQ